MNSTKTTQATTNLKDKEKINILYEIYCFGLPNLGPNKLYVNCAILFLIFIP